MRLQNFRIALVLGTFLLFSCSDSDTPNDDDNGQTPDPVNPITGDPVETNSPNTGYSAAFDGQTRIGSVQTTTPISATAITTSLSSPWGITALPDGRLLVTEKEGTLRIVTTSGGVSGPITGIPAVNSGGQGGLLGVRVDPDFSTNRMVYWVFSENVTGGTVTSVAKGKLSDNETHIENTTVIYRADPAAHSTAHYGGRILFDATGHLLVSTGDRSGMSTRPLAQSLTGALGKIVRITTDGNPAPGNPTFTNEAIPELYSMGHRNPQGMALHPVTGGLWQSEHGPRGGDEINHVQGGKNYGWPTITYGIEYDGQAIGGGITQQNGLEQPAYYWDPSISPSGMTFYSGNRIPEWENNLFLGALSGQHIVRLVINDDNRVVGEERLLTSEGQRFRDIAQGTDGALYAITDTGRLYRIDAQ